MDFGLFGLGTGSSADGQGQSSVSTIADLFSEIDKKSAKKTGAASEKQAGKKTDKKAKTDDKPAKDVVVNLPVTVMGRSFSVPIEPMDEKKQMKMSEIVEHFINVGYEQFKIAGMSLYYAEAMSTVFVCDNHFSANSDDVEVSLEGESTVSVYDGALSASFTKADLGKEEEDDVCLGDVLKAWVNINPSYAGCGLYYDAEAGICYPMFEEIINPSQALMEEFSYSMGGDIYPIENERTVKELIDSLGIPTDKKLSVRISVSKENKDGAKNPYPYYYVSFVSSEGYSKAEKKSAVPKKVETKYELPFILYNCTFPQSYELTAEMFGGKKKVTLDEIKKVMAQVDSIFGDTKRNMTAEFHKERNMLSVAFLSGRKGCGEFQCIHNEKELEEAKKKAHFLGFFNGDKYFKVLSLPHGVFFQYRGEGRHICEIVDIGFERKLPLIPKDFFESVVEYFKEDLTKEAMVRIYYNTIEGNFFMVKAEGKRSKVNIEYLFPNDERTFNPDNIIVCEIHSHNTMPAFFSPTDDEDEKDGPGVFGVIGTLDKSPSVKFRVGIGGMFKDYPASVFVEL